MSLGEHRGYQVGAVATASPATLVRMLFDAAVSAVGRARVALAAPDTPGAFDVAHRELTRAQDIVLELQLSLDHELGGDIAAQLATLYDFCMDRLIKANVAKDPALLDAVSSVISTLRSAWDEAANAAEAA
jgi:flagellar protein FliS